VLALAENKAFSHLALIIAVTRYGGLLRVFEDRRGQAATGVVVTGAIHLIWIDKFGIYAPSTVVNTVIMVSGNIPSMAIAEMLALHAQ
jgi:hypothetical protein